MQKTDVLVSVIIPVFNLHSVLAETLDSVLAQTFPYFEILVVDDGSADSSIDLIKQYVAKDSRIFLLHNTHKKGVSGARNTGIDNARGEWLAFLDGDDVWSSDAIESRLDCLQLYPNASFISADYVCFSHDINKVGVSRAISNKDWNACFGSSLSNGIALCIKNPITLFLRSVLVWTGTVLVKTELVKHLGGFEERLNSSEDDHLWMRVAANVEQFIFVPKVIAFYRQREHSLTRSTRSLYHDAPKAYKQLLNIPEFSQYHSDLLKNIRFFVHQNCFFYRKNKRFYQALKWGVQGVYWAPASLVSWKNLLSCCLFR